MDAEIFTSPQEYAKSLVEQLKIDYAIDPEFYEGESMKQGLRNSDGSGVIVGASKIGSVQGYYVQDGMRVPQPGHLYYRGIDIEELVNAHKANNTFGYEEVAYLLLYGNLPNRAQAELFNKVLSKAKSLPERFFENEVFKTPCRDVMNTLSRCVLSLYAYDDNPDDISVDNVLLQSIELIARFPTIVAQAYAMKRHYFNGESLYIHNPKENLSMAQNFLRLVRHDKSYTDKEAKLLDTLLMLHAEHSGGNNSTFACRIVTSSNTDTYSAISAAIGSLKGPLHGGANAAVMGMIHDIQENVRDINDNDEMSAYLDKLLDKEAGDRSGKLYGIGHAVYTMSDPRAIILKKFIRELAEEQGGSDEFVVAQKVEELGVPKLMARKHMTVPVCANVDLYSGIVYSMLGIPEDLYTPLFAVARISGWCAHRLEELITGAKLIRPAYRSAVYHRPYIPIDER